MHFSFVVWRLSSGVCHLAFVVWHLSSVVCRLSSVVCRLSFVVCHLHRQCRLARYNSATPFSHLLEFEVADLDDQCKVQNGKWKMTYDKWTKKKEG